MIAQKQVKVFSFSISLDIFALLKDFNFISTSIDTSIFANSLCMLYFIKSVLHALLSHQLCYYSSAFIAFLRLKLQLNFYTPFEFTNSKFSIFICFAHALSKISHQFAYFKINFSNFGGFNSFILQLYGN